MCARAARALVVLVGTLVAISAGGIAVADGHPASGELRAAGNPAGATPPPERRTTTPVSLTLAARAARAASSTQPLTPAEIHSAYSLPTRGAPGQTIAVVSAYNDPSVESDMDAYTRQYNLPQCTTSDKCLRVLNQAGRATPLPPADPTGGSWITESGLGTEIAHAVCQSCSILLVEANSDDAGDISAAVQGAIRAGATVLNTTLTVPESLADSGYFLDYSSGHTAVVAAAGDGGYMGGTSFPAALPDVLAVGGTNLQLGSGGQYGGETAWSGTQSGCSEFEPAPLWQQGFAAGAGCGSMRASVDLAAMSDPGAVVHITGVSTPGGPWYAASGTSLSAPIIAGAIGLAGSVGAGEAQMLYEHAEKDPNAFHDVLTGSDSPSCASVMCKAGRGWDGPTGLGTPHGLAAFLPSGGALDPRHPAITVSAPGGISVNGRFQAGFVLRNTNPFAITGTITLRRTLAVGRSLRMIVFASGTLRVAPLGVATESLTIAPPYRDLLKALIGVDAYVVLQVRGPAGNAVTESTRVLLRAS